MGIKNGVEKLLFDAFFDGKRKTYKNYSKTNLRM